MTDSTSHLTIASWTSHAPSSIRTPLITDRSCRRAEGTVICEAVSAIGLAPVSLAQLATATIDGTMRISHKLRQAAEQQDGVPTWSYEYFPPKTDTGMANLYDRIERMAAWGPPAFVDVTWGAGGSRSTLTTAMVDKTQRSFGIDTCMHLICTGMPAADVKVALQHAYDTGCQNILALRGDPPTEQEKWEATKGGFAYARDLVRYIRQEYGDHFDIGVAGYSEGHPECEDEEVGLQHLKEKVDAGANFIVTQMFYDVDRFLDWVRKCRTLGIDVPVIPGIMPISAWDSFNRRVKWSEATVPDKFYARLEAVKDDEEQFKRTGAQLVAEMCRTMLENGIHHLHFYTMNLEKATQQVMAELGLVQDKTNTAAAKAH